MPTLAHKSAGSVFQTLFFIAIFINLAYVNLLVFQYKNQPSGITTSQDTCGKDCVSSIYSSIKEATTSSGLNQLIPQKAESSNAVKEYYVSFGSGTGTSEDWADVSGLQMYIDSSKYPNIQTVTFEASIQIPTGNQQASVRLFNATDKHPVWYSDVSHDGGETKLLFSKPIKLDTGNKLYSVQMKNSLKFQTNVLSSRVHIVLQ